MFLHRQFFAEYEEGSDLSMNSVDTTPVSDDDDESSADWGDELDPSVQAQEAADDTAAGEAASEEDEDETAAADLAAEQPAPDPAAPDPAAPIMVPKSRYDSAAGRARAAAEQLEAAQARIAELEGATQGTEEPARDFNAEYDALDERLSAALADGDHKAAVEVNRAIRQITREEALAEARAYTDQRSQESMSAAQQEASYNEVVNRLEAAYPELHPDDEAYSQEVADEVLELAGGYIATGRYTPAAASEKAAYIFFPEADDEPAAAPAPTKRTTDVKRNLDAARRTPPDATNVGRNSDEGGVNGKLDVNKLGDEEFDALPASKLAELRGDLVH